MSNDDREMMPCVPHTSSPEGTTKFGAHRSGPCQNRIDRADMIGAVVETAPTPMTSMRGEDQGTGGYHQLAGLEDAGKDGSSKPLVLLAEDNRADVFLVKESLRMNKLTVDLHVVDDGALALEFLDQVESGGTGPVPSALLLDLNLPKHNGIEILERTRSSDRLREVPVIIVTSSDSPTDREATSRLGATRYFRKPADFLEFMKIGQVLKQVLDEYKSSHH